VDPAGGIFVADSGNNRIRHVSPNGDVTSVAGSGVAGFADDVLLRAAFRNPHAISVTPAGVLLVADTDNHRIRAIDLAAGLVSTYAGAGVAGFRDATVATQAYILGPVGLAYVAHSGDLFVTCADSRIRVVRLSGAVETVLNGAGVGGFADASGLAARFHEPGHMALNEDETVLYVADRRNNRIRAVALASMAVTTVAGTEAFPATGSTLASDGAEAGGALPGSSGGVRFSHPYGIAFYLEPLEVADVAGNASLPGRPALLITELRSHRLRRIILEVNPKP